MLGDDVDVFPSKGLPSSPVQLRTVVPTALVTQDPKQANVAVKSAFVVCNLACAGEYFGVGRALRGRRRSSKGAHIPNLDRRA
jgi:hypothetical protein